MCDFVTSDEQDVPSAVEDAIGELFELLQDKVRQLRVPKHGEIAINVMHRTLLSDGQQPRGSRTYRNAFRPFSSIKSQKTSQAISPFIHLALLHLSYLLRQSTHGTEPRWPVLNQLEEISYLIRSCPTLYCGCQRLVPPVAFCPGKASKLQLS